MVNRPLWPKLAIPHPNTIWNIWDLSDQKNIVARTIPLREYIWTICNRHIFSQFLQENIWSIYYRRIFNQFVTGEYLANLLQENIRPICCRRIFGQFVTGEYLANMLQENIRPICKRRIFCQFLLENIWSIC